MFPFPSVVRSQQAQAFPAPAQPASQQLSTQILSILQSVPLQQSFSLTQYLNQIYGYIDLVHRFRQEGALLHEESGTQRSHQWRHSYNPESDAAPDAANSTNESNQDAPSAPPPITSSPFLPLMKPFVFYHKFNLAKLLYQRDLHDAIQYVQMKQRILERQVEVLYERVANYVPYRQTPKYAPLYWIFSLSHMDAQSKMGYGAQGGMYGANTTDQPAFPSLLTHLPMSDSLRQMLSARPSINEGTYGQSWGVYSTQVEEPSLIPRGAFAQDNSQRSTNATQPQRWTVYPELDQLMERNFFLRSAMNALLETWSHNYFHLHKGADLKTRQRLFNQWCFELLNERERRVQRLIKKLRTQDMKQLRRDKSLFVAQYNQIKQLSLPHPMHMNEFD